MDKDLLFRLALARVRGIGAVHAKTLLSRFGEAEAIFRAAPSTLEKIWGIGMTRAKAIAGFNDFSSVEKELVFLEKYRIRVLVFTDKDYPRRLAKFAHAPALLFYKGNADLNAQKIIAVVGTRTPTEYGKQATDHLLKKLAQPGLLIVSGLAYGIDAAAHRAALRHQLPTIGILGHGLDRIYPEQNTGLAREMIKHGGLLTEFRTGTEPDEHNFPIRNRTVAAMSDALVVVESGCRGGSMLTVENAIACRKKVFALPGRITDNRSAGCNALIAQGKARLLISPHQVQEETAWGDQPAEKPGPAQAVPLRPVSTPAKSGSSRSERPEPALSEPLLSESTLSGEEKSILHLLRQTGGLSMDELLRKSNLNNSTLAMALLNLELQGWLRSLPGKIYRLQQ